MKQDLIAVRECCEEKDAFPFYNIVEQKVLLYEVIGFLTSYAYYLSDTEFEKVSSIVKTIVCLRKYPTPTDSFQDAVDIEMENTVEDYETSGLWGYFLLWIGVLGEEELYMNLKEFLDKDLENVTKCVWFLRADEEEFLYEYDAMVKAGEGIEIRTEKDFDTFVDKIDYILEQYKNELFSYEEYSFPALEMLVCRYYGYVPRVINLEDNMETK